MIERKAITEENFLDAFHLKLAPGQERFVSHPIRKSAQGRGYGGAALDRVVDYIRTKPFGTSSRIALTCNKDNLIARKLYESKGFQATGLEDEDEIELVMTIPEL